MSFCGATRHPWFGMDVRTNTELKAHERHVETEARMRTMHGYLPPAICEECRLPECKWNPNSRTCPMDEEYEARRYRINSQQYAAKRRREGIL